MGFSYNRVEINASKIQCCLLCLKRNLHLQPLSINGTCITETERQTTCLSLYWIDQKRNLITEKQSEIAKFESCNLSLGNQRHLATLAVNRKQIIHVKCAVSLHDTNPEIILCPNTNSTICAPIVNVDQEVLVVLELFRTDGYALSQESVRYVRELSKWLGIWLSQHLKFIEETRIANVWNTLTGYLLEYVNEGCTYECFLSRYMIHCKQHIMADKVYFYECDVATNCWDFSEEVGEVLLKTATKFKFRKCDSFCYQVCEGKTPLIVKMENNWEQLDKDFKQDSDNPLRYMLFYPVLFGSTFLGIIVFGKTCCTDEAKHCEFSEADTLQVSKIVSLFADALTYKRSAQEKERQTADTKILRETFINLLQARMRPQFSINGNISTPKHLSRFDWELTNLNDPNQLTYLCKMFQSAYHFNWERLKIFLLCVQLAHNDYPYHNVGTTFHICRTVYCIIEKLNIKLKPHERASLMIAAVVYYCGHNGLDNHVMLKTEHPLTKVYKTYMKENHRTWMLKLLLDHTKLLADNKESGRVISTANTLLFKSKKFESKDFRQKILNMLDAGTFNLSNETHRLYMLMVILRIGVHGRHMQPFNVAKKLRDSYYEEKLRFGDMEKEKGYDYVERKNREMHLKISHFEIKYISDSVLTTLDILTRIFPETNISMAMPNDVLKAHQILVRAGTKQLWDPDVSIRKNTLYD